MIYLWIGFFAIIAFLLALDLGVFHRHAHAVRFREAIIWSCVWVTISLCMNGLIYFIYEYHWFGVTLDTGTRRDIATFFGGKVMTGGFEAAEAFFTGYLLEKALSVDNIFVMAMLFRQFRVEPTYQHRVLFWGIIGAIISRSFMIFLGVWLVTRFSWLFYVFGAYLAFAGVKMVLTDDDDEDEPFDPEKSLLLRIIGKVIPITRETHGGRLTAREDGKLYITKLGLALVVIELTDVIFALDSVPAVLAITTDSFIVLTSNIFAILGLRAMYFVLATMLDKFRYLQIALAIVLVVIGTKMFLHNVYDIPTNWSLIGIGTILALGVTTSLLANRGPGMDPGDDDSEPSTAAPGQHDAEPAQPAQAGESAEPDEAAASTKATEPSND